MYNDKDNSTSDITFTSSHPKIILNKSNFDIKRAQSLQNIENFWAEQAQKLVWNKHWDKTLEWNPPFAKWFVNGLLNASINCLDKHVNSDIKNKAAIIWEGENGESITLTYYQLYQKVNQFSNALKNLGIKKGDRVTIYLPMVPELPIAILACSRIGAIHNVIFSGLGSNALVDRINDARSKVIITADGGFRRGNIGELKKIVDQAIESTPSIQSVVVLRRTGNDVKMKNKDIWWHEIIQNQSSYCEPELVESTHPLFILYTSGTTAKPKGVVHSTGGYLTHIYSTVKWVFDFNQQDIFFSSADIAWITGHSYTVYAPLMHGVTEILYEGTPDYPQPDRYWSLVEKYGITILYTTPTALRMYRKYGNEIPNSFNLSTLRLLGTVGESINPDVWMWYFTIIGKEKCPIVDTWWQTETGGTMISHCTGIDILPMKPGSGMFPIPGVDLAVVDDEGNTLPLNQKGYLVIRKPWPGMLMTLWNDDDKYKNNYWKKNYYFTGDYAIIDDELYFWLLGRVDDIIKPSGHRLGTIELESTFISHKSVSEAAVTSKPDMIKGESIVAFLVLKEDFVESDQLRKEIIEHIRNNLGAIATPSEVYFVNKLPKTRSGKIMRRLLKSIASGLTIGDTTTLDDDTSIKEIQKIYNELNGIVKN
ncbi:MAG TPA: acetate--CoA ligase [Nitrososphaeraceae archaeon]|nr:acetate--CoA ligase [Nitrososphaeraceae archaeon]